VSEVPAETSEDSKVEEIEIVIEGEDKVNILRLSLSEINSIYTLF